jgi:hypothetical protein
VAKLFNIFHRSSDLGVMTRTRGQLAIAERTQLAAQRLPGDADPEFLPDPLAQIDNPPANDTMHRRDRSALDDRRQCGPVRVIQPRRLAGRATVDQTVRAATVELHHPVPHDLARYPANAGGLRTCRSIINRCQRQQTACLRRFLALARSRPQTNRIKIISQRNWHGEPSRIAMLNQTSPASPKSPQSHRHRALELVRHRNTDPPSMKATLAANDGDFLFSANGPKIPSG